MPQQPPKPKHPPRQPSTRKGQPPLTLDLFRLKRSLGTVGSIIVITLVLLVVLGEQAGWFGKSTTTHSRPVNLTGDMAVYHDKPFRITKILDGDTIRISQPDGRFRDTAVRFWGINTPEIKKTPSETPTEPWGIEARDFVIQMTQSQPVTIRLEEHSTRDKYNRLLAYVYLPDGRLLNEMLLERGHARAYKNFSHSRLNEFLAIERKAQRERKGLWGGNPPGWKPTDKIAPQPALQR